MTSLTRWCVAVFMGGVIGASTTLAQGQGAAQGAPAAPAQPAAQAPRSPAPTRDPRTPGYVTATNATALPDGAVPPIDAYGNFILGPTHPPAAEMTVKDDVPRGVVHTFTMESTESKIYPGIARTPGTRATVDPADPAKRIVSSGPAPYTRRVAVCIPQVRARHCRPVHRRCRRTRSTAVHGAGQPDRAEARSRDDCDLDCEWQQRPPRSATSSYRSKAQEARHPHHAFDPQEDPMSKLAKLFSVCIAATSLGAVTYVNSAEQPAVACSVGDSNRLPAEMGSLRLRR